MKNTLRKIVCVIYTFVTLISVLNTEISAAAYIVALSTEKVYMTEDEKIVSTLFTEYGSVTKVADFDTRVIMANVVDSGIRISAISPGETVISVYLYNDLTGQIYMGTIQVYVDYKRCPSMSMRDVFELGHWAHAGIDWAIKTGVTMGTTSDTFSPDEICTRAQVVTFLWRAAGSPKVSVTNNTFKDVPKSSYYYDAVQWAVMKGITTGTSRDTFSPALGCSRAQVVTFLWRAAGSPKQNLYSISFADVDNNSYYYQAVIWACNNNITRGTGFSTFSPDENCTRAQIVTFMFRGR